MRTTSMSEAKLRESKAMSRVATCVVTAALAGMAIPAALPASASAYSPICEVFLAAKNNANAHKEYGAGKFWNKMFRVAACSP